MQHRADGRRGAAAHRGGLRAGRLVRGRPAPGVLLSCMVFVGLAPKINVETLHPMEIKHA
jgi:hypothetical protein